MMLRYARESVQGKRRDWKSIFVFRWKLKRRKDGISFFMTYEYLNTHTTCKYRKNHATRKRLDLSRSPTWITSKVDAS